MRFAVLAGIATNVLGCGDVSQDTTVFACDEEHPCPGDEVCSGSTGICLDHAVVLYEDFETALDASRWTVNEIMGTVGVDMTAGHWGDSALRTESPGMGTASIVHRFAEPLPAHVFVRVFIRQTNAAAYAPYFLLGRDDTSTGVNLHGEGATLQYKVTRDGVVINREGGRVTADAWMCFELELDGLPATGDAEGDLRIYIDDVAQADLAQRVPLRALESIELGGYSSARIETLFDDLIADTVRVGCAR